MRLYSSSDKLLAGPKCWATSALVVFVGNIKNLILVVEEEGRLSEKISDPSQLIGF